MSCINGLAPLRRGAWLLEVWRAVDSDTLNEAGFRLLNQPGFRKSSYYYSKSIPSTRCFRLRRYNAMAKVLKWFEWFELVRLTNKHLGKQI